MNINDNNSYNEEHYVDENLEECSESEKYGINIFNPTLFVQAVRAELILESMRDHENDEELFDHESLIKNESNEYLEMKADIALKSYLNQAYILSEEFIERGMMVIAPLELDDTSPSSHSFSPSSLPSSSSSSSSSYSSSSSSSSSSSNSDFPLVSLTHYKSSSSISSSTEHSVSSSSSSLIENSLLSSSSSSSSPSSSSLSCYPNSVPAISLPLPKVRPVRTILSTVLRVFHADPAEAKTQTQTLQSSNINSSISSSSISNIPNFEPYVPISSAPITSSVPTSSSVPISSSVPTSSSIFTSSSVMDIERNKIKIDNEKEEIVDDSAFLNNILIESNLETTDLTMLGNKNENENNSNDESNDKNDSMNDANSSIEFLHLVTVPTMSIQTPTTATIINSSNGGENNNITANSSTTRLELLDSRRKRIIPINKCKCLLLSEEKALNILHNNNYNIKEALISLKKELNRDKIKYNNLHLNDNNLENNKSTNDSEKLKIKLANNDEISRGELGIWNKKEVELFFKGKKR